MTKESPTILSWILMIVGRVFRGECEDSLKSCSMLDVNPEFHALNSSALNLGLDALGLARFFRSIQGLSLFRSCSCIATISCRTCLSFVVALKELDISLASFGSLSTCSDNCVLKSQSVCKACLERYLVPAVERALESLTVATVRAAGGLRPELPLFETMVSSC